MKRGLVTTWEVRSGKVALGPFNPYARCIKCANQEVATRYVERGCVVLDCNVCDAEQIVRTCQRCHYQWAEAVLS